MYHITGEMQERHQTDSPRYIVTLEDLWQDFSYNLKTSLGPAELLIFEGFHLGGQLGRDNHIGYVTDLPAAHLSAVAQVEVFRESIPCPPAGILDTGPT